MTTLWDTTGSAVVKELAAQRRTGGAVMSGVALTLVVVADESRVTEAEEAANLMERIGFDLHPHSGILAAESADNRLELR